MVDIQALLKDANPPYLANKDWEPGDLYTILVLIGIIEN